MAADEIVKLTRCWTEVEATSIAAALRDEGIHVEVSGGISGGFRAEAPGSIWVLVRAADKNRAEKLLEDLRESAADIDWSKVDVDEPPAD
jgi:hypothetical protein